MDVVIAEADPADEPALRAWWEVAHAAHGDRPLDLFRPWEWARRWFTVPPVDAEQVLLVAYDGDRPVGSAWMEMPLRENDHLAFAEVHVTPAERRRGIGTLLFEEVESRVRAAGRTTVVGEVFAPLDAESDGSRYAAAHGYQVANLEHGKVVDLAATSGLWDGLAEEAREHLDGYRLVEWGDVTPEEHVAAACRLYGRFISEAPMGDLELHPVGWTPERLRRLEERRRSTGTAQVMVMAQASDGELVGYTNALLCPDAPRVAYIGSTLVLPEHRGHRLGLAMKVRLHQLLRERFASCELLVTSNAGVNKPMNDVNERLGYRVVERLLDVQKRLGPDGGPGTA